MPLNFVARDSDNIRIAIIGMGKMGNYHLNALRQLAGGKYEDYYKGAVETQLSKIKIAALCDVDPDRLTNFAPIPVFTSLEDAVEQTAPHLAIISAPTHAHFELAKNALENGLHILIEKPIVTHARQVEILMNLAERNGCRIMSGHVERYNPVAIKIVSLLKQTPGKVTSYSFRRIQKHDGRIKDDIIVDKVIHDLDLAVYFFGLIETVSVKTIKKLDELFYEATLEITHKNTVKGTIFVSWFAAENIKIRQVEISVDGKVLSGDFYQKRLSLDNDEIECEVKGWINPSNNQIKDELVDFIGYCSRPDPRWKQPEPLLTTDEIVHSVRWLEEIKKMTDSNF